MRKAGVVSNKGDAALAPQPDLGVKSEKLPKSARRRLRVISIIATFGGMLLDMTLGLSTARYRL